MKFEIHIGIHPKTNKHNRRMFERFMYITKNGNTESFKITKKMAENLARIFPVCS